MAQIQETGLWCDMVCFETTPDKGLFQHSMTEQNSPTLMILKFVSANWAGFFFQNSSPLLFSSWILVQDAEWRIQHGGAARPTSIDRGRSNLWPFRHRSCRWDARCFSILSMGWTEWQLSFLAFEDEVIHTVLIMYFWGTLTPSDTFELPKCPSCLHSPPKYQITCWKSLKIWKQLETTKKDD